MIVLVVLFFVLPSLTSPQANRRFMAQPVVDGAASPEWDTLGRRAALGRGLMWYPTQWGQRSW
jgi:hypothetical protein